jgi:hypothetical protein
MPAEKPARSPWEGGKKLDPDHGVGNWAPSAIGFHDDETSIALDKQGESKVISDFKSATKSEGWFSVMEIHGAHGYLLHEFMSPLSNLGRMNMAEVSKPNSLDARGAGGSSIRMAKIFICANFS